MSLWPNIRTFAFPEEKKNQLQTCSATCRLKICWERERERERGENVTVPGVHDGVSMVDDEDSDVVAASISVASTS